MKARLGLPFFILVISIFLTYATCVQARDALPFASVTYAKEKAWCKINRDSAESPDNSIGQAFVNLSQDKINWSESFGIIRDVSVLGDKTVLTVDLTTEGSSVNGLKLELVKTGSVGFTFDGVKFYSCGKRKANPWIGKFMQ